MDYLAPPFVAVIPLLLAGGCAPRTSEGHSVPITIPANAPDAVRRAAEGLESSDPQQRAYAAARLGRIDDGGSYAVDCLLPALQDPHHWVRALAADSLGRLNERRAIGPLLERLNDANEDRDVRARAAESLGRLAATESVEPLIAALNHTVWYVRYQSVIALGRIGDLAAISALEHTARWDPDYSVRDAARQTVQELTGTQRPHPARLDGEGDWGLTR